MEVLDQHCSQLGLKVVIDGRKLLLNALPGLFFDGVLAIGIEHRGQHAADENNDRQQGQKQPQEQRKPF